MYVQFIFSISKTFPEDAYFAINNVVKGLF